MGERGIRKVLKKSIELYSMHYIFIENCISMAPKRRISISDVTLLRMVYTLWLKRVTLTIYGCNQTTINNKFIHKARKAPIFSFLTNFLKLPYFWVIIVPSLWPLNCFCLGLGSLAGINSYWKLKSQKDLPENHRLQFIFNSASGQASIKSTPVPLPCFHRTTRPTHWNPWRHGCLLTHHSLHPA